jgi:hypothetical protein
MFVPSQRQAEMIQRQHDPALVRVLPHYSFGAYRGSSVIIVRPRPEDMASETQRARWDEWMEWVPTRLNPGKPYPERMSFL